MLKITSEDIPHTLADTRDGILYPNHKKMCHPQYQCRKISQIITFIGPVRLCINSFVSTRLGN